jgi:hypothetical protein
VHGVLFLWIRFPALVHVGVPHVVCKFSTHCMKIDRKYIAKFRDTEVATTPNSVTRLLLFHLFLPCPPVWGMTWSCQHNHVEPHALVGCLCAWYFWNLPSTGSLVITLMRNSKAYVIQIYVVEVGCCGDPVREIACFWPASHCETLSNMNAWIMGFLRCRMFHACSLYSLCWSKHYKHYKHYKH